VVPALRTKLYSLSNISQLYLTRKRQENIVKKTKKTRDGNRTGKYWKHPEEKHYLGFKISGLEANLGNRLGFKS
jgi:hypothetical protein